MSISYRESSVQNRSFYSLNTRSLLKRRQIRGSRSCAIATAELLRQVVANFKSKDVAKLLARIRQVGNKLIAAQPREMVVGNIVRRVLGLVREVAEEESETNQSEVAGDSTGNIDKPKRPALHSSISTFSPLKQHTTKAFDVTAPSSDDDDSPTTPDEVPRPRLFNSYSSYMPAPGARSTSLFGILSQPDFGSGSSTPLSASSPGPRPGLTAQSLAHIDTTSQVKDIKAEVIVGINEIIDELHLVDEQIAGYALDHIHSNEIVLTHTSSVTIQKFLLAAARKRKFTVVHVEGYPNDSDRTHATLLGGGQRSAADSDAADGEAEDRFRPLTSAGITVIMIPDSAVFAIMSRVNKVILTTHTVLANGGLVAASGARTIATAARAHQTPVVVLSGVYKLSPIYPFDTEELIEWGDASAVVPFEDGRFVESIDTGNAVYDYVPVDLVDLYITNL